MQSLSSKVLLTWVSGLALSAMAVATTASAETGRIRAAGPVLAAPSSSARPTGTVRVGTVATLTDRRGFWVKIQAGATVGWLKLSQISLSRDSTGRDIAALATGRTGGGNVVSASGGRGLDNGDDISRATPNTAAVARVATFAVTASAAEAFARAGHLTVRHLAYVPAPPTGDETRP